MPYRIRVTGKDNNTTLVAQYKKTFLHRWQDIGVPTSYKKNAQADIDRHKLKVVETRLKRIKR